MSFKINRIKSEKESYRTTVGWLNDFSKSANFQDRIKERRDAPVVEKFSTIEDKMDDIRSRVGFSNLKSISASESSDSQIRKVAQDCESPKDGQESSCGVCKKREVVSSDDELSAIRDRVASLLLYIEKLIPDRGYSTSAEVYGHCSANPSLNFSGLSKKIDHGKFDNFLQKMFKKYHREDGYDTEYIPRDSIAAESLHDIDDMTPSYFKTSDY